MNTPDPVSERRIAIDALDQAIVNLSARINAANYELRLVHEHGYEIRKDCRRRWYFRRPDRRAVPEHGYHPDDMTDDDVELGDPSLAHRASAEARRHWGADDGPGAGFS